MARYKPVRRDTKGCWSFLVDWVLGSILFITIVEISGYGWLIDNYESFAYLIVVILFAWGARLWRRLFFGTVNGRVILEKSKILSNQVENIEILLRTDNYKVKVGPIFENAKGEYLFQSKVPTGHPITLTVDVGNGQGVTENISEIEGVRWLFGKPKFGLPLSSGQPKQVDLVIPNIPQNAIATHKPVRARILQLSPCAMGRTRGCCDYIHILGSAQGDME